MEMNQSKALSGLKSVSDRTGYPVFDPVFMYERLRLEIVKRCYDDEQTGRQTQPGVNHSVP
jgi:hypothetical protein